jgi:hypothetical protein
MAARVDQIACIIGLLTNYKTKAYPSVAGVHAIDSASTKCYVYPKGDFGGDFDNDDETFVVDIKATSLANLETAMNLIRSLGTGHPTTGYYPTMSPSILIEADETYFCEVTTGITAMSQSATSAAMSYTNPTSFNSIFGRFTQLGINGTLSTSDDSIKVLASATGTSAADQSWKINGVTLNAAASNYKTTITDYIGVTGGTSLYGTYSSSGSFTEAEPTDGWVAETTYTMSLAVSNALTAPGAGNVDVLVYCNQSADDPTVSLPVYRRIWLAGTYTFNDATAPRYLEFKTLNKDEKMFYGSVECKARWTL